MKKSAGVAILGCGLIPLVAHAQGLFSSQPAPQAGPILHQDLPPSARPRTPASADLLSLTGATPQLGGQVVGKSSAGDNPRAIAAAKKLIPEPGHAPRPEKGEPVFGEKSFGADRQTEMSPDYATGGDDTLHYAAVFNPAIIPFKRMSAFDQVRADFSLAVMPAAATAVPVGGTPDPARDAFWASMVIAARPGQPVPIPSVAPDMRILSYEAEPAVPLTFSKDGGDNYYVTATGATAQTVRVVMAVDAAATYFAPSVPANYRVTDLARAPGAPTPRPLPAAIARSAHRALGRLTLDSHTPLSKALNTLIYYFRSFSPETPPAPSGDIYWDLFSSQAGVCRHRSYAFMITANALGIPTRMITNEAHAFVESWVPDQGWIRIDLGGAANVLEAKNTAKKTMFQPRGEDPFAKPQAYRDGYTRLSGDIRGLTPGQLAEAPYRQEHPAGGGANDGHGGGAATAPSAPPVQPEIQPGDDPQLARPEIQPGDDPQLARPEIQPGDPQAPETWLAPDNGDDPQASGDDGDGPIDPGLPPEAVPPDPALAPTAIIITGVAGIAYRGESLTVSGRVVDERGGVPGLRVDIFLAQAGTGGGNALALGSAITQGHGQFSAALPVPLDLPLAAYEVFATTRGDASHQSSASQ